MIPHWTVLLLCIIGALCIAPEHIGRLPRINRSRSRPSLDIFNGTNTSVTKYPCIASLKQKGFLFGTAIILKKNWLLTTGWTAAWVKPSELEFRVGSDYYDKGGQVLKAAEVIIHPNYTGSWDWDIALVKTDKPIEFGDKVKPATLATTEPEGGTKGWVAGWGEYDSTGNASEVLREAPATTLNWKTCQDTYGGKLTERLYCTWDKKYGPCDHDFGDPMTHMKRKCVIHGLFAGGYGCTPGNNPILYVNTAVLRKWIKETIKSNEDDILE